jgi:hypothetical protein
MAGHCRRAWLVLIVGACIGPDTWVSAQAPESLPIRPRFGPATPGREPESALAPAWAPAPVDGQRRLRFMGARLIDGDAFALSRLEDGSCVRITQLSTAPSGCADPLVETMPPREEGTVLFVPLRVALVEAQVNQFVTAVIEALAARIGASTRGVQIELPRFDRSIAETAPLRGPTSKSFALGNRILAMATDADALAQDLAAATPGERWLRSLALARFGDARAIPGLVAGLAEADATLAVQLTAAILQFGERALEPLAGARADAPAASAARFETPLDDLRFARAQRIRTEGAFDAYLQAHPNGRHRSEAEWNKAALSIDPVRNNRAALSERASREPEGRLRWALLEALEDLSAAAVAISKPGAQFAVPAIAVENGGSVGNITLDGSQGVMRMTSLFPADKLEFSLSLSGPRPVSFTGAGSRVRFRGGRIAMAGFTFEGEPLDPLSFVLVAGRGLVYLAGRGTVTLTDGTVARLPVTRTAPARRRP